MKEIKEVQAKQHLPKTQEEETIRQRAFEIYQERGMTDGLAVEDWLQAESELSDVARLSKAA